MCREKLKIKSYPVEVKAGLIWAYMGALPAPLVPTWEPFTWGNGFRQIVIAEVPCNWLQCQENSIDPVHFEWMHTNWARRQISEDSEHGPKHLQVGFDAFDHGFVYRRQRDDLPLDHSMWTVGRVCLWPNCFFLGDHFEWRVPIDDENTLNVSWMFNRVPNEAEPFVQESVPAWRSSVEDPETGKWYSTHVMNQDFIAWVGQGRIADRTQEHLGESDRGIIMFRKRLVKELEAIARGEEPGGLIRDPEQNECVALPIAERDLLVNGMPLAKLREHPMFGPTIDAFIFQAGQPPEVWKAYRRALGLQVTEVTKNVINLG